jgi:glycosyltransferase 2 family protein
MKAHTQATAQSGVQHTVWKALIGFVFVGLLVYISFIFWAGWALTIAAIRQLDGLFLVLLALGCCSSYVWRFVRWHACLAQLGDKLPWARHFLIYLSGLAFTVSPGKAGETFRSVFLLREGVDVRKSLACFLADRASDVLGLVLLGVCLAWVFSEHQWLWLATWAGLLGASVALAFFCQQAWFARARLRWAWLPAKWSFSWLQHSLNDWARLWANPLLALWVLIAFVAYGTQALMFGLLCQALGMSISVQQALFIFVKATLFGAATLIPGGLGAMEAALVIQLHALGVPQASAITAAILIRLMTLWLALLIGLLAFGKLSLKGKSVKPQKQST